MARTDSFYLAPEAWAEPFRLQGPEARHAAKVLRIKPGGRVRCFDGQGREGIFVVASVGAGIGLRLESEQMCPPPETGAWLALGWNKSARRGWLLEKAVELGAAGVLFWEAQRGQGRMPDAPKESWQAQLVAGAKQCGNPWLPRLEMISGGVTGLIGRCRDMEQRFLLWEAGGPRDVLCTERLRAAAGPRVFVLGPEGGIAQDEAAQFRDAGFAVASLGPRPLRWETAALLCLGLSLCAHAPVDQAAASHNSPQGCPPCPR